MERWVPLFEIFLHSPSPEGEASQWLQQPQPQPQEQQPEHALLSLLSKPTHIISSSSPPPNNNSCMWIQTLPYAVQSRILSFLAIEHRRFSGRQLHSLASQILHSSPTGDSAIPQDRDFFWVARAARNLLDAVNAVSGADFNTKLDGVRVENEEGFDALPPWLQSAAATNTSPPLLPWLPLSNSHLCLTARAATTSSPGYVVANEDLVISAEPNQVAEEEAEVIPQTQFDDIPLLSPQVRDRTSILKAELLVSESASEALRISHDIERLCFDSGGQGNALMVLSQTEPWEADDETSLVLLSHLSRVSSPGYSNWPSHVLCAAALPKLLVLQCPASRVLLSAVNDFCKLHQKAAVNALMFPLILRKEGINAPIGDVLARIIKECLHPAHVSAFCQKLLCDGPDDWPYICLPCHQDSISQHLVWTESLFVLFQHILARDIFLTPDTVDHLVYMLDYLTGKFLKSLKFCNFLLCLVTKCSYASKHHKLSLVRVAEMTDTFVTKSILSKLSAQ